MPAAIRIPCRGLRSTPPDEIRLAYSTISVEREFLKRMAARYERLAATLPDAADVQDMRGRSLSQIGQTYIHLGDSARGLDTWRQAADVYRGRAGVKPADAVAARSELRAHVRRCRA